MNLLAVHCQLEVLPSSVFLSRRRKYSFHLSVLKNSCKREEKRITLFLVSLSPIFSSPTEHPSALS